MSYAEGIFRSALLQCWKCLCLKKQSCKSNLLFLAKVVVNQFWLTPCLPFRRNLSHMPELRLSRPSLLMCLYGQEYANRLPVCGGERCISEKWDRIPFSFPTDQTSIGWWGMNAILSDCAPKEMHVLHHVCLHCLCFYLLALQANRLRLYYCCRCLWSTVLRYMVTARRTLPYMSRLT